MREARHVTLVLAIVAGLALVPGEAQAQRRAPADEPTAEITLLPWWVQVEGFLEAIEETPVGTPRIDVVDTLGLADTEVQGKADLRLRLGRRHRLLLSASRARHEADTELQETITFEGRDFPLSANVTSATELEEAHLLYEFLVAAGPTVQAGILLGGGGLRLTGAIEEPTLGRAAAEVTAPAPLVGAELRLSSGRLGAEVLATGFPRVEIEDLEAFLLDLEARASVGLTDTVAVVAGYRRYELDFEELGVVEFGLLWQGFTAGVRLSF